MYHIMCKFGFGEGQVEKWISYLAGIAMARNDYHISKKFLKCLDPSVRRIRIGSAIVSFLL